VINASRYQQRGAKVSEDKSVAEKREERQVPRQQPKITKSSRPTPAQPKRLLQKAPRVAAPQSPSEDSEPDSRSSSPGLVLDSTSRAFKERAAQDEDEISALEKKLGLKTKKLPKSFDEDGLGDLLDGLDSGDDTRKRKREEADWLQQKRRKAQARYAGVAAISDAEDDDLSDGLEDLSISEDDAGEDDFASFSENEVALPTPKRRENPYVAPTTGSDVPAAKYIPPSLRKVQDSNTEALSRIRRQIQGHLNKLSEANIISILNEIEKMYQSNARQDITSTLIDLLLALFSDRSSLQSTFVILHASFIAAVYKVLGIDFGAEFVSRLVERVDGYTDSNSDNSGKESNNLVSLLSYLFTFNVINSTLVFDYLRLFLEELNETNTELVLRIVRDCGPQLRQDDPSSLKRIVQLMQKASAKIAADGKDTSVRTKFMIETINDLKNNKMRAASNNAGVASEHITQMRKALGSLNSRNIKGSEPLRISREDIKNSDKKGKWWLVGASWKGNIGDDASQKGQHLDPVDATQEDVDTEHLDLMALARQYRMNTEVRRSIFVSIMSASDFQDAHLRLLKLRLKRSQEQEIPKVLLRCAGAEQSYNPYYTLVARKLCSEKSMKKAFQFAIWDFFKTIGERRDDGDESDDNDNAPVVELREIVSLAKLAADLILDGALMLSILKVLNLPLLKEQATTFLEVMLIAILTGKSPPSEKALVGTFSRAADCPQLIKPLQYFIRKKLRKSDLVPKGEREALKRGVRVAGDTLAMLETPGLAMG
jgi:nucleolar MIF4G domain-containing protein 1